MSDSRTFVGAALAQRLMAMAALRRLPALYADAQPLFEAWLKLLPPPLADAESLDEFVVAVTGDLRRVTWRAASNTEVMIGPASDFFSEAGAAQAQLETLSSFGSRVNPDFLGTWLEVKAGALNAGWYLPDGAPVESLATLLDDAAQAKALSRWAVSHGLGRCALVARSVAGGPPLTEVLFDLPGQELIDQVAAGLALCEALGAEEPSEDPLAALLNGECDTLQISLWLTPGGVVKSGLRALRPTFETVIALAQAVGNVDLDGVAAFQGTLLVKDAVAAEVQVRSGGEGLEIFYALPVERTRG